MKIVKYLTGLIADFKIVRLMRMERENRFPEGLLGREPAQEKAALIYRKMYPKTPYTCCDDSHEAGFFQGFIIQERVVVELSKSLEEVLAFGAPKPEENPNMFVAWEKAHKLLAEVSSQ